MKQKLMKTLNLLLTLLLFVTSLASNTTPLLALENDIGGNENPVDVIRELGTLEDVFPQLNPENEGIMTLSMTSIGERYGKIYIANQYGYDYISHLYVDGETVFCIEPMALFKGGLDYYEDTVAWDSLSETQRQAIWEINYYGYSYPGHQTPNYYVATQLMIWEVVDRWYDPYTTDGTVYLDISAEIDTINALRSQPQGRPSFANQTVKTGLNTPVTLTDSKGTLSQYNIQSGNGVSVSSSGNDLTVAITSENYDSRIAFNKNYSA